MMIQRIVWMLMVCALVAPSAHAAMRQADAPIQHEGGEASLILPDLGTVEFFGINARALLMGGIGVCALGLLFGFITFTRLRQLPVHRSMLEVSELIYETCKTYLTT